MQYISFSITSIRQFHQVTVGYLLSSG